MNQTKYIPKDLHVGDSHMAISQMILPLDLAFIVCEITWTNIICNNNIKLQDGHKGNIFLTFALFVLVWDSPARNPAGVGRRAGRQSNAAMTRISHKTLSLDTKT